MTRVSPGPAVHTARDLIHRWISGGQRCVDDNFLRSGTYPPGEGPCAGPSVLARETPYPAGSFRAGTLKVTARPNTSGCGQALRLGTQS